MTLKTNLAGIKVLVIEDEPLILMLIEDLLADCGCVIVAVATNLEDAMSRVQEKSFDVAMLDVNLNGKQTFEVAKTIDSMQLPFVFSTGYGSVGIPPHLNHVPVLQKPFGEKELAAALAAVLWPQSQSQ